MILYIIQSLTNPDIAKIGITGDIRDRLQRLRVAFPHLDLVTHSQYVLEESEAKYIEKAIKLWLNNGYQLTGWYRSGQMKGYTEFFGISPDMVAHHVNRTIKVRTHEH